MVVQEEREKIEGLLSDAIITLCKNGITFHTHLDIKAQVVLTADRGEAFCINLESTLIQEAEAGDRDDDGDREEAGDHDDGDRDDGDCEEAGDHEEDGDRDEEVSSRSRCKKAEDSLRSCLLTMKKELPDSTYGDNDVEDSADGEVEGATDTPTIPEMVATPVSTQRKRATPAKRGRPRKRKRPTRKASKKETLIKSLKPDPDSAMDTTENPDLDEDNTFGDYQSDSDYEVGPSVRSKVNKSMSSVPDHVPSTPALDDSSLDLVKEKDCYKCNDCEFKSKQRHQVKRHMKVHSRPRLVCYYCDEQFDDKFKRRLHANEVHSGEKPECKICKKRFSTLASLKIHENNIHRGKKLQMTLKTCDFCDYTSRHYGNMLRHMRCNHGKLDLSCIFCHKDFDDKVLLKKHIHEDHGDETVCCAICKKDYKTPSGLHNHMKADHGDGVGAEDSYKCAGCKYATFSRLNLEKHMLKSVGEDLDCPWCQKKTVCKVEFKKHLTEEHPTEAKRKPCEFCDKVFFSKNGLYAHKKIFHTGEDDPTKRNIFTCHICGKGFPIYDYLKRHMRSHDATYEPYECPKCHKRFKYHRNCKTHKEGCMNESGYQCHLCGKTLKNEYCLREHVRNMHTDEKKDAYPCRKCGMSFNYSGSRSKHEKTCRTIYTPSQVADLQHISESQELVEEEPQAEALVEVSTIPAACSQDDYRFMSASEVEIAAYATVLPHFSDSIQHVHASLHDGQV